MERNSRLHNVIVTAAFLLLVLLTSWLGERKSGGGCFAGACLIRQMATNLTAARDESDAPKTRLREIRRDAVQQDYEPINSSDEVPVH